MEYKENNKKRVRNSDSSLSSGDLDRPSRKQVRLGEEDECARINYMFNALIEGPAQTDITDDPMAASSRDLVELSALNRKIKAIIRQREETQLQIQGQMEVETAAKTAEAMRAIEASQIVDQNIQFINAVVNAMTTSQERLGRAEREDLNNKIIELITQSVTNSEVRRQLEEEGIAGTNVRGLFDALIKYCTAMASYSYNSAPTIISNLGSILAGSSIIAGTVCGIGSMNNTGGSLLLFLSQLLQTGSSTVVGLYFLRRGGLPVQDMLRQVGSTTVECIRGACSGIARESQKFMNSISQTFNEMLEDDTITSTSSTSSTSTASTASTAVTEISEILSMPEDRQILLLQNENSDDSDNLVGTNLYISEGNKLSQSEDNKLSQLTEETDETDYFGNIDGGKKRKSRRHMKMRRTRKGRKGRRRKGRMTKKGRKHHRTMKRYR